MNRKDWLFYGLLLLTAVSFVVTIEHVFLNTPVDAQLGIVYKIFYFHVPAAYCMYVGAAACFVGSIGYLVRGKPSFDALGRAGAELAVVFGAIVMVTGPLWAAKSWGRYWTWDPRLTTTLLSLLLYVAYALLRSFSGGGSGEKRFAAALGILGAANIPIIHYSVKKWSGQHPTVITAQGGGLGHPAMKLSLLLSFVSFTLLIVLLLWVRVRHVLASERLALGEADAIDLGLDESADDSSDTFSEKLSAAGTEEGGS